MEENILIIIPKAKDVKYLRIMIVGDPKTGKSTFLENNSHPQNIFYFKINQVDKILTDGIHGVMVFMDVSDPKGLQRALYWFEQVKKRVPYRLPMLLVINKIDAVNRVSTKAIEQCWPTIQKWICCSAKNRLNVKQTTEMMEQMVLSKIKAEMFNALLPPQQEDLSILEELFECLI